MGACVASPVPTEMMFAVPWLLLRAEVEKAAGQRGALGSYVVGCQTVEAEADE